MYLRGQKTYKADGLHLLIKVYKFHELSLEIQESLLNSYSNIVQENYICESDKLFKEMNGDWLKANEIYSWDIDNNSGVRLNALYRSDMSMICPVSTTYINFMRLYKEAYEIIVNENTSTEAMKKELSMNHYTHDGTLVLFEGDGE